MTPLHVTTHTKPPKIPKITPSTPCSGGINAIRTLPPHHAPFCTNDMNARRCIFSVMNFIPHEKALFVHLSWSRREGPIKRHLLYSTILKYLLLLYSVSLLVERVAGAAGAAVHEHRAPQPGGRAEGRRVLDGALGHHRAALQQRPQHRQHWNHEDTGCLLSE